MAMHLRKFATPEIVFGLGSRELAPKYASNLSLTHCLVVTDKGVKQAGWVEGLLDRLRAQHVDVTVFDGIHPNPRDYEVREGAAVFREKGCDGILAIGGGSPIDAAKGIGFMVNNDLDILDFEGVDQIDTPGPPLICIPTTAGTSADISQFSIINNTTIKSKISIVSQAAIPDVALVDPETTFTMDKRLTAATGLDALTHAVEAFGSIVCSPTTDLFALDSVTLVYDNLMGAIEKPDDVESRTNMMRASMHAGLAFSNAILGGIHAMAHSLGGFLDAPHGECNAILLPHVVNFNFSEIPERYVELAKALYIDVANKSHEQVQKELVDTLHDFVSRAGIPSGLRELGMALDDIPQLASFAMEDACMLTNPRKMTQEEVEGLYEEAW